MFSIQSNPSNLSNPPPELCRSVNCDPGGGPLNDAQHGSSSEPLSNSQPMTKKEEADTGQRTADVTREVRLWGGCQPIC